MRVHGTTRCVVTLEPWLPFATMPCGAWRVPRPGPSEVRLEPNASLADRGLVTAEDLGTVVGHGNEGEFPTWITFGP